MSLNVPNHFVQQFATNVQLLLMQRGSKLRGLVMTGSHVGESAQVVQQFGAVEMQPVTGRFQPMGRVDANATSRWVYPEDWDLPQLIDKFDKLRMLTDPQSIYVQNAHFAAGRKMDDIILDALFSVAKVGRRGADNMPFPGTQTVAVDVGAAGPTGLNVEKLKAAKKLLRKAEVDLDAEPLTCIINAEQEEDLLSEIQIISADFAGNRPVLKDGRLDSFLGINFVHSERTDANGSGYRRVPLFAKSGMYLGMWNDMTTSISQRNDLQGEPWQAYVYMTVGATRVEEKKVVEILCSEA